MAGHLIDEQTVAGHREDGDTATTRLTIDASTGCELLEQRVVRFDPGWSRPRTPAEAQEVLYVVSGRGTLRVDGSTFALEPEMGAYVAPGETYEVKNPGPDELCIVSVRAPFEHGSPAPDRRIVRYADQPVLHAGSDREFRFLVDRDVGCRDVTQFMGLIPPGRAPLHSHTYDEVIYVVEGEGVLHLGDRRNAFEQGSCIHLPPLVEHCLENTGPNQMRVLGVFYPQGDPASRAYEAVK